MSFQPVLPVLLILVIVLPVLALAVRQFVRGRDSRVLWAGRGVLVLACALLLLRPGVAGGAAPTLATDLDIVLVVDTTASIVAEDWDGDRPRLDGVRADVEDLVAHYAGARFALITFDAEAEVRVPLTTDATALVSSLTVLRPEVTAQSHGSSIGVAAEQLEQTLDGAASVSPDRTRMVFYFGDGEQTSPDEPESFAGSAELVSGGGVFGYGTPEGGPMRITTAGTESSAGYIQYEGEPALSVIDPENLEQIADDLGVPYQERSASTPAELPEAPTTTTTEGAATETVAELTWVVALVIAAWLMVELGLVALRLGQTVRVRRTRTSGGGS